MKGNPASAKTMGEVAFAAYGASLPEGIDHGLEAISYFDPPNFVWPFGAHICIVEVDPADRDCRSCRTTSPSTTAAT